MYKHLMRYLANVNNDTLKSLVENDVDLIIYEPSANWIKNNLAFMKRIYFFLPKNFNFDELVEECKKYNITAYNLIKTDKGKKWLAKQLWIMKKLLD